MSSGENSAGGYGQQGHSHHSSLVSHNTTNNNNIFR
jgi:hypothetical protein